jgi:hypothetical protein
MKIFQKCDRYVKNMGKKSKIYGGRWEISGFFWEMLLKIGRYQTAYDEDLGPVKHLVHSAGSVFARDF